MLRCIPVLVLVTCPLFAALGYGAYFTTITDPVEPFPCTSITPSAEILFQENFNGYNAGSYPSGWFTHDNRPSGTYFDVASTIIDSGNCLRIVDNQTADGGWGRKPFSKAIDAGVLEFKVRVQGAAVGSNPMQHYVYLQDSTNTTSLTVNMQQNLTGDYWTIGIGTTMNATHLAEDTTYSIKLTFNKWNFILDWLVIDLYVDNALFLNDQLALFRPVDRIYVGSTNPSNRSTWLFDTFVVTDSIAGNSVPSITSPPDMSIPPGNSGQSISWTISDPDTMNPTYVVYQNGTPAGLGTWSSGVSVQFALPSLVTLRSYNYTIVATDGLNATVKDTVIVRTTANTLPVISGRATLSFEYGSHGENLTWTITDPSVNIPASASQLRRNGTLVASHAWASGFVFQFNTTTMNKGTYNFTLTASDGLGNSTSFTTILTIVGDLPPRISSPADVNYQIDTTSNVITWTISDFNITAGWYAIYKDDVLQSNTTWAGPTAVLNINIDGLAQGGHVYKIVASDGRETSSDTVAVTVINPVLDMLIIVLVIVGAAIAVAAVIAVRRKKKAGVGNVKRKVPRQHAAKPAQEGTQQPAPAGVKVVTCRACGTPFTLTTDYVKQYAGQTFKCTKCRADIPI
jgi:hypothetical protein